MKEHQILMRGPLVVSTLADLKTQTRRLFRVHPQDGAFYLLDGWPHRSLDGHSSRIPGHPEPYRCPYGQPGDQLWVRETWQIVTGAKAGDLGAVVRYRDMELLSVTMPAQKPMPLGLTWDRWRPSIHMPRWASRISLEVTEVRVQRIQDISDADIQAEGILEGPLNDPHPGAYRGQFQVAWGRLYPGTWATNAWVWAVSFRRVKS